MSRKPRDFRAEYARRIVLGKARGLSRSAARGHARTGEASARGRGQTRGDAKLEKALRKLRSGASLTRAAKSAHVSPERLRTFLQDAGLAKRDGRRWAVGDVRPRRVETFTRGEHRILTVVGHDQAVLAGAYWNACGQFVRTNDLAHLAPFAGKGLTDLRGRQHPFETKPNAIHRLAAADAPAFHEIYAITAN